MKIIVSHDVDHLRLGEHLTDRYLPGTLYRSIISKMKGEPFNFWKRFAFRTERLRELRAFNQSFGISETYFFATRKGLSLSYAYQEAAPHIKRLLLEGVEIGLHGQSPDSLEGLQEEVRRLKEIHQGELVGIRNHYLRKTPNTLKYMEACGFRYDSTHMGIEAPFQSGSLWEIPISVMDVTSLSPIHNHFPEAWENTMNTLEEAHAANLPYFVVNFHDLYFSDGWKMHRKWYTTLIEHFHQKQYSFISFREALTELSQA